MGCKTNVASPARAASDSKSSRPATVVLCPGHRSVAGVFPAPWLHPFVILITLS